MGGNALSEVKTIRLDSRDYMDLTFEVSEALKIIFPNRNIDLIPAYRNKLSFGDADFIISSNNITEDIRGLIINRFAPKQVVKNSNVWSFDYNNFQIDIILAPDKYYDTSLKYFSWNDLGNLEGKIAHKFGTKYGHDGLKYVFRDGTYEIGNIELTLDIKTILDFIGLDYRIYSLGFDDLEDIFRFVSSSKYFNPDIYLLDNLNHTARVRDRKRKTYQEFLKWCGRNKPNLYHYGWGADKTIYRERIREYFPHFQTELDKLNEKREINKKRSEKFNGNIVSLTRNLTGPSLGDFIIKYKQSKPDFISFLDKTSAVDILEDIKQFPYA